MPRPKRILTQKHEVEVKRLNEKLSKIEPVSAEARQLLTTDGFINYYLEMRNLYSSYLEAYEVLEEHYTRITGRRRFSDFDSLRRAISRQ
ncbi:MAG: hypothetical protein SNH18_09470 [Rikenellaceae bacterium]